MKDKSWKLEVGRLKIGLPPPTANRPRLRPYGPPRIRSYPKRLQAFAVFHHSPPISYLPKSPDSEIMVTGVASG
jgi:hypothetical protein